MPLLDRDGFYDYGELLHASDCAWMAYTLVRR